MNLERGQVLNARFTHALGRRGKKRPVVVVQTDVYNKRLRHAVVVQLTTNLDDKNDPACFLIEAATPDGQAAAIWSVETAGSPAHSLQIRSTPKLLTSALPRPPQES